MPPRLAHKKSRRGCQRCKLRKVKCDEIHPSCTACKRHSVECEYFKLLDPSPPSTSVGGSGTGTGGPPETDASSSYSRNEDSIVTASNSSPTTRLSGPTSPYEADPLEIEPDERRNLELQLLHHFVQVVSKSFPPYKSPRIKDLWQAEAIFFAFEHSFLLNAIFAISALHAAVEGLADPRPVSRRSPSTFDYPRIHRIYLNRAVQEQRLALSSLNSSNADSVLLTSILLSHTAMKLLPEYQVINYAPPIQWLSMTCAITTVVRATAPLAREDSFVDGIIASNDPDLRDFATIFDPSGIVPFQSILDFDNTLEFKDKEIEETYTKAVAYVGSINRAVSKGDPLRQICRRLMSIGPVLPPIFITLLEQRRPRALVILAHHMAMSKCVDQFWMFRGAAEREVYGIQSILPQEWQWAMAWPLQTLQTLSNVSMNERNGVN